MLYAAYGSNLHPLRLTQRTPSARFLGSAELPGFALRFHKRSPDGSGKCNIVVADDSVWVAVYELDAADKRLLDRIEGVGSGYHDERIDVPGYGDCAIYLGQEDWLDDRLSPWCWYHGFVSVGCEWQGFPAAYRERIAAIRYRQDPDARRRRENEAIRDALLAAPARKPAAPV